MLDMRFMKITSVAAIAGVAFGIATSVAAASPVHHHRYTPRQSGSCNWRDDRYIRRGRRGCSCNERVRLRRAWPLWRPSNAILRSASLLRSAVTIPPMVKIVERDDKEHAGQRPCSVN